MLLWAIAIIFGVWGVGTVALPLYRNWTIAKQLHVPIIVAPWTRYGTTWKLFQSAYQHRYLKPLWKFLPFARLMRGNWAFEEKYAVCATHGELFALVTPANIELYVADINIARQILSRGKDFPKPLEILKKVDVFGKNVASVEGADWKRHRRFTAAAFSDKVNETVWDYSTNQASHALAKFLQQDSVSNTRAEMIRISFSVLMKACMGIEQETGLSDPSNHNLNIVEAECLLTRLLSMMSNSGPNLLPVSWLSRGRTDVFGLTKDGMKSFFTGLIDHRKHNQLSRQDFLSSLLASIDKDMLSDDEINGNLFLLMFAGHETTANTLVYIIYLLAIFPEWQTWAVEGLNEGTEPYLSRETSSLVRIEAVMYETLRLYGPVLSILRGTQPHTPQIIDSHDGSTILVPGNVQINILTAALHTHPSHWGSDPMSWNPSRWIKKTKNPVAVQRHEVDFEEIDTKKLDCFLVWSEGSRVCPGKKFSQFEIIAVLKTLLCHSSVHIMPRSGMDVQQARREALAAVEKSCVKLTLQMQSPESVHLRWEKRHDKAAEGSSR